MKLPHFLCRAQLTGVGERGGMSRWILADFCRKEECCSCSRGPHGKTTSRERRDGWGLGSVHSAASSSDRQEGAVGCFGALEHKYCFFFNLFTREMK